MPEVIKSLLRSRKFVTAVAALVATVVVMAIPTLETHQEFLRNAIIALAGLAIGAWGLEDFAAKVGASKIPEDVKDIVAVLTQIVSDLADRIPAEQKTTTDVNINIPPNG